MDTCLHEAGHAVVATKLNWTVYALRVNADTSGACYFDPAERREGGEHDLRRDLAVTVAGKAAEALAHGRDPRDLRLYRVLRVEGRDRDPCSFSDFVWRKAQLTEDRDPADARRWVEAELPIAAELAAFILERHWGEVSDLAAALNDAPTFNGVTAIFTEAGEAALAADRLVADGRVEFAA
jgi:hypothetical protein